MYIKNTQHYLLDGRLLEDFNFNFKSLLYKRNHFLFFLFYLYVKI